MFYRIFKFLLMSGNTQVIRCRKRTLELSMTSRRTNTPNVCLHLAVEGDQGLQGHRVTAPCHSKQGVTKMTEMRLIKSTGNNQLKDGLSSKRQKLLHGKRSTSTLNSSPQNLCIVQSQSSKNPPVDSPETNYKAFVTTILLTGTLLFFWIPYLLVSSLSIYFSDSEFDEYPEFLINLKFHAIDFLPLLTYLTDPIVYGVRIRCVRLSYKRLFGSTSSLLNCRKHMGRSRRNFMEDDKTGRRSSLPMTSLQEFSLCV